MAVRHGEDNVICESSSGEGTRVDLIVKQNNELWFYEIKTHESPRQCLREAIGQLLEYAFWPGAPKVTRLVIVGETPMDEVERAYLLRLKQQFSLPLEYEVITLASTSLCVRAAGF